MKFDKDISLSLVPSLIAIFPPLYIALFNSNSIRVPFYGRLFLSLILIGLLVFGLFSIIKFFLKNTYKAIVLCLIFSFFIFYYGYFFEILNSSSFLNFDIRHRHALLFWGSVFLLFSLYALLTKKNLEHLCKVIGIFTLVLFIVSLSFFSFGAIKNKINQREVTLKDYRIPSLDHVSLKIGYVPDIYYIVPDMYANQEILEKYFGYDNSEFISYLESKNFTVVRDSKSNYQMTMFSIPSTLNMDYGDNLIPDFLNSPASQRRNIFENNEIVHLLRSIGYKYISVSSDNTTFSGVNADQRFGSSILMRLLIRPTIFDPFYPQRLRDRILDAFGYINQSSKLPGHKIIIAHILSPHDPIIFGPNGEKIGPIVDVTTSEDKMSVYIGQLQFINKKLKETIENILNSSPKKPIIIIQSDHGVYLPDSYGKQLVEDERFKNFSAYLLPETEKFENQIPIPTMNVNTFRFILDQYFGTSFGLLENKIFYMPNNSSLRKSF